MTWAVMLNPITHLTCPSYAVKPYFTIIPANTAIAPPRFQGICGSEGWEGLFHVCRGGIYPHVAIVHAGRWKIMELWQSWPHRRISPS